MRVTSSLILMLWLLVAKAQVVSLQPTFATENDTVTVIFDASQGNGALANVTQVFAHTGVITNLSTSPTDWRHVQGTWGTNDTKVKMTNIGGGKHQLKYHIRTFYNVPTNEIVQKLSFVFRNQTGSIVGRESDGSDIFVPIYTNAFAGAILLPSSKPLFRNLTDSILVRIETNINSTINLLVNNTLIQTVSNSKQISRYIQCQQFGAGKHWIHFNATQNGETITDSTYYIVQPSNIIQAPPAGVRDGVNYINATTAILQLYAPYKQFVYLIGDFNNWEHDPAYLLKKAPTGDRFWITLTNLTPQKEYAYQYAIDQEVMKIADPYAEKILDPWNDAFISDETFPDLKPYPVGKTTQTVSVLQTAKQPYVWDQNINFTTPSKHDIVVYELLVRDFTTERNYQSVIDRLNYLQALNINCIHLMPVGEFEGNISWGYNPSFFFSLDKYYGTPEKFKEFVEECHKRGIAVVIDMVLNHAFGQNPYVRMWFDQSAGDFGKPALNNPFFNRDPKHDFNVGYDFNHQSPETKNYTKRIMQYWIQEYKIDGYRFDLSKGFTQNNTLGNIGAWNAYDQSRIDIWNEYKAAIQEVKQDAILILEHFADNSEEKRLANDGFILWGNGNHAFGEATMGFNGDPAAISWQSRGFDNPGVLGYMESHDEERIMFKCLSFGNNQNGYNIRNYRTALKRMELATTFLFSIPGPKMMWQFGELGYPFSINYCENGTINPDCRTSPKPVKWDYLDDTSRVSLLKVNGQMIHLKTNYPTFNTNNFQLSTGGQMKRVRLNHPDMDAIVLGNFSMNDGPINPNFQYPGRWYEYFTGDSIQVSDVNANINLLKGEYRVYTSKRITKPNIDWTTAYSEIKRSEEANQQVYPNPSNGNFNVEVNLNQSENLNIFIYDLQGKLIQQKLNYSFPSGKTTIHSTLLGFEKLQKGTYILTIQSNKSFKSNRLIIK
jgi:hypothetical protein